MDEKNIKGPSKQIAALMFTDIVGSVALQQKLGTNSYTKYVHRHDEIIKDCLSNVEGAKILNETGDGFLIKRNVKENLLMYEWGLTWEWLLKWMRPTVEEPAQLECLSTSSHE